MSLKAFFKEAAIQPENLMVVISPRFVGADSAPLEWELRPLEEKENAAIKQSCISKRIIKGQRSSNFDGPLYTLRMTAASVVYPDLRDAELQQSYGVVGAEALLQAMLLPGEMTELQQQVQIVNGYDIDKLAEEMDEVKNS